MASSSTMPSLDAKRQVRREKTATGRANLSMNSIFWLALAHVLVFVPWWTIKAHYRLPTPKTDLFDASGSPQISESRILKHVWELSDPSSIGFRTVGTKEHAAGDAWAVERVKELVDLCDTVKKTAKEAGRVVHLDCEWDRQQGSGTHKFDIMNRVIYKSYQDLTNILLRLSSPSPESKTLAILLNSHVDSTLPSPGAADDGLAVAICLEIARVLIESVGRGEWEMGWSVVILLNNAEESFQDASHLFSTQHPWAQTIRSVINLEAAGTKGPELLFQATSEEMVRAYQGVPHPYGNVLANDIFASGVLMSDTDFRQFDQYLLVPGIDMAVVGHSYFYHTSRDVVENIEPGVAQHFGENVLEIVRRMTIREKGADGLFLNASLLESVRKFASPLAEAQESPIIPLNTTAKSSPFSSAGKGGSQHSRRPDLIFFSLFGSTIVVYSGQTARAMYALWTVLCVVLVWFRHGQRQRQSTATRIDGEPRQSTTNLSHPVLVGRAMVFLVVTLVKAVLYANCVAFVMRVVLEKQLSWFAGELRPIGLYVWPTLLAMSSAPPLGLIPSGMPGPRQERALLDGALLLYALLAVFIQGIGFGSAVIFFIMSLGIGAGLLIGLVFHRFSNAVGDAETPLTYVIGTILPLALAVDITVGTLDVFVPLTGRMPPFVPSEHIIASQVSVFIFFMFPLLPALVSRLPNPASGLSETNARRMLSRTLGLTAAAAVVWYGYISGWGSWPFDAEHPKRVFISYTEDLSSGGVSVQLAGMDGAPGFDKLVNGAFDAVFAARGGVASSVQPSKVNFTLWNTEWNPFFPLGELLDHYAFPALPEVSSSVSPPWKDIGKFGVVVKANHVDKEKGERRLQLEMRHSGIIWTVLAFDAHVLSWSLDVPTPKEHSRHHIKEASFYGHDVWSLEMVIKIEADTGESPGLDVSLSGIVEGAMWPGKQLDWLSAQALSRERGEKGAVPETESMSVFELVSGWMDQETNGSTDVFGMHNVVWRGVL